MKKFGFSYFIILLLLTWPYVLNAQLENLHGDERYSYSGLHSGNMIRTTFYNDGQVGTRVTSPDDIGGVRGEIISPNWLLSLERKLKTPKAKLSILCLNRMAAARVALKALKAPETGVPTENGGR